MNATRSAAAALFACALVAGVVWTAAPASAADAGPDVTWGVQPAGPNGPDGRGAFDFQVAPGTLIEDWIAVTNYSSVPADFRVYASDAVTDYDTAQYTLIGAEQASTDLGAWTVVDSGPAQCPDTNDEAEEECAHELGVRITLEAGETQNVPIAIAVPADATPGDHSAGVVASFEQESADEAGNAVLMEQRVGARIYLRVDGPLEASVGVRGVTANYDSSWAPFGRGRATVGFDVANTGNVRLTGDPRVVLKGPFGIRLNTATVEPVANLMPGGTGHVTAEFPRVWPLVLLSAEVVVEPVPGDGDIAAEGLDLAPVNGSARAWAVSWTGLTLILVLGWGVWFVLRRRRARRLFGGSR